MIKLEVVDFQLTTFASIHHKGEQYYSIDQIIFHYFKKPNDWKNSRIGVVDGMKENIDCNDNINEKFNIKTKTCWIANLPGIVSILLKYCPTKDQTRVLLHFIQSSSSNNENHCCFSSLLGEQNQMYTSTDLSTQLDTIEHNTDIGGFDSNDVEHFITIGQSRMDGMSCFEETEEDIEQLLGEEVEYNNSVINGMDDTTSSVPPALVDTTNLLGLFQDELMEDSNQSSYLENDFDFSNSYCSSIEHCPSNLGEFQLEAVSNLQCCLEINVTLF